MKENYEKISREVQYGLNPFPASHDANYPKLNIWDDIDPWNAVRMEKVLRSIILYNGNVKEYAKVLLTAVHRAAEKKGEEMAKASS